MKTTIYLTTSLAFIIQAMVNGQTPGSPAETTNNEIKQNNVLLVKQRDNEKAAIKQTSKITYSHKKSYAVLIPNAVVPTSKTVTASNENNFTPVTPVNTTLDNNNTSFTSANLLELLQEAENLNTASKKLVAEAKNKQGLEKSEIIKEANELYKESETKKIIALEIAGRLNNQKFNENKSEYDQLTKNSETDPDAAGYAKEIYQEAEQIMRMAREMREESYAMPNNSAKLGTMSNAEEKETSALNKQKRAIIIIKKSASGTNLKTGIAQK